MEQIRHFLYSKGKKSFCSTLLLYIWINYTSGALVSALQESKDVAPTRANNSDNVTPPANGKLHRILVDTDVDTEDICALLYLLKLNCSEFHLKESIGDGIY